MTTNLSSRQGLLTRACNRLKDTMKAQDELIASAADIRDAEQEQRLLQDNQWHIQRTIQLIETDMEAVDKALENYSIAADNLNPDTPMSSDILEKVAGNSEAAQELLGNASAILAKLRVMECHFRAETPQFERYAVSDSAKLNQAGRGLRNLKDPVRALCFYCDKGGHSPKQCKDVPSREQRIEVLKKKSLCWNCGEQGHLSTQCARGACRICNEFGHHTSICKKAEFAATKTPTATVSSSSKAAPPSKKSSSKPRSIRKTTAKMHSVTSDSNNHEECESNLVLH
ncbi:zinc knuckle, partial [Teladorsagia circumcincta]